MVSVTNTATSTDNHYPYSILQCINYEQPQNVGSKHHTGRHVRDPIGHWGGPDFVIFDKPRRQLLQEARVSEEVLRRTGSRPQHRSTLDITAPDAEIPSQPWRSEMRRCFSGSPHLPPAQRARPVRSVHSCQMRFASDSPFDAKTTTGQDFGAKEVMPPGPRLTFCFENKERMQNGRNMANRLTFQGPPRKVEDYRSQYVDVHNRLGNIIMNIRRANRPKSGLGVEKCSRSSACDVTTFRRTSGNRILSQIRQQTPSNILS